MTFVLAKGKADAMPALYLSMVCSVILYLFLQAGARTGDGKSSMAALIIKKLQSAAAHSEVSQWLLQSLYLIYKPVSYAHLCQNILGLRRVFLNFPPDVCHIYPKRLILIGIWPPYVFNNLIIGDHLARILS